MNKKVKVMLKVLGNVRSTLYGYKKFHRRESEGGL